MPKWEQLLTPDFIISIPTGVTLVIVGWILMAVAWEGNAYGIFTRFCWWLRQMKILSIIVFSGFALIALGIIRIVFNIEL